jgi:hypothetical protein
MDFYKDIESHKSLAVSSVYAVKSGGYNFKPELKAE